MRIFPEVRTELSPGSRPWFNPDRGRDSYLALLSGRQVRCQADSGVVVVIVSGRRHWRWRRRLDLCSRSAFFRLAPFDAGPDLFSRPAFLPLAPFDVGPNPLSLSAFRPALLPLCVLPSRRRRSHCHWRGSTGG